MNAWLIWVYLCPLPDNCTSKVMEYRYYADEAECWVAAQDAEKAARAKYPKTAHIIHMRCKLAPR